MNENIKSDDYINLPSPKKVAIKLLILFFDFLYFIAAVVRKSKLLLLAGLISGLILGYFYHKAKPSYFKVSMIAQSTLITKKTVSEMIDQLNLLAKSNSGKKLAGALKLSEQEAAEVLLIDTRTINDEPLKNDTSSKLHVPFKIIAYISSPDITDKLQHSIVDYLNNEPYLKKTKEDQKEIYNGKLAFIENELSKLDSLKREYNRFLSSSKISATFYNNAFNPADIYVQSNNLQNQKEAVLAWLSSESDVIVVIDGFKSTVSHQSGSLLWYLFLGAVAGIALCFLLGFFIELNKRVKKYH